MVTKQTVKILTVSGQLEIGLNLLKHHVFRVWRPLDWPTLMNVYRQNLQNKYFANQGTTQKILAKTQEDTMPV